MWAGRLLVHLQPSIRIVHWAARQPLGARLLVAVFGVCDVAHSWTSMFFKTGLPMRLNASA